jgi:hypothetical protein
MQRLEVSGAVRPLKWPLGVKWLISNSSNGHSQYPLSVRHVTLLYHIYSLDQTFIIRWFLLQHELEPAKHYD